jgi:hypothetical protein
MCKKRTITDCTWDSVFPILGVGQVQGSTEYGWGTCFFISKRHIMTAAHIVYIKGDFTQPKLTDFYLVYPQQSSSITHKPIKVIDCDTSLDIALFEINEVHNFIRKTTMSIEIGTNVLSFGYHHLDFDPIRNHYEHYFPKLKGGIISNINIDNYYLVDTIMYKGSSGCPLLDESGGLVGIQSKNLNDPKSGQSIDFSLSTKIEEIEKFLIKNNVEF